ncbi:MULTISPECIES: PBSX family phage terminase large subunit [Bhargavaea]|uniref:PBSX family phage terminase large subunit n=1 Tax=Bhargavaea changchunensis TaxID=2134037 RepID=A0ABW2NGM2_9BACL|nr:PBSX family phage terminase large subunit [Bhargavaea sp. CC-171006]
MTTKVTGPVSIHSLIGKGYNRFWHDRSFYRVVKGSRGSKKSKTAALNFISRIMKYPWANLLVVRRYSNTNKQSTFTDLKWAANKLGVAHLFKFNESMPEITYTPTGQKILFRGLDDPLKITSITVDIGILSWLWVEEAYQLESEDAFSTLVESIRGSHDDPEFFKQVTITFNPWSERHWLKAAFFDPETRRANTFATTTTFRCNEWLDEVDVQRYMDLYETNPRRARIVCDGEWGVAEGLVFNNFEVRHFEPVEVIRKVRETTHGQDYGFTNDPTTQVSSAVDLENKELWIYDEHYEYGMLTDDIFNMVREKGLLKASITGDNAEPRMIEELRRKGLRRIHGAIKKPGSIKHGIQFLKGFKIYIHPSCENAIEEFNTYVYQRDKEGKWLNEPEDANNHIIDALRYSMERYHLGTRQDAHDKARAIKSLGL